MNREDWKKDIWKIVKGTDTVLFIDYKDIPSEWRKNITYVQIVIDHHPQQEDPNRTRSTVGRNIIEYPGDVSTPTDYNFTAKIVWNSVVSTTE